MNWAGAARTCLFFFPPSSPSIYSFGVPPFAYYITSKPRKDDVGRELLTLELGILEQFWSVL